MTSAQPRTCPYKVGDRVEHGKLGHGTVIKVVDPGGQVQFDMAGQIVSFSFMDFLSPSDVPTPPPRQAANDNKPRLPIIVASTLGATAAPPRDWYIPDLVPARQVTLMSGDGGTGKSLVALQISAAGALGIETLGLSPKPGRVLVLAAEDDRDELHRRLADVLKYHQASFDDLGDRLELVPLAGVSASLMTLGEHKRLTQTPMLALLEDRLKSYRPQLLVLDTSADVFDGDEINRVQVRQFVGELRRLAMEYGLAVLLLSHPSVAGMASGSGLSGSTAWNNSVRSRLYLIADPDDEDGRILSTVKANYGKKGGKIRLRWEEGAFALDDGKPSPAVGLLNKRADEIFRAALSAINCSGQRLAPTKGVNYAPAVMFDRSEASGLTRKQLEAAMHRLLAAGLIKVVTEGPPSKRRQRLIVSAEDFGPSEEPE